MGERVSGEEWTPRRPTASAYDVHVAGPDFGAKVTCLSRPYSSVSPSQLLIIDMPFSLAARCGHKKLRRRIRLVVNPFPSSILLRYSSLPQKYAENIVSTRITSRGQD